MAESPLMQRMVGATVIILLVVIFVPMLLPHEPGPTQDRAQTALPAAPAAKATPQTLDVQDVLISRIPRRGESEKDAGHPPDHTPDHPVETLDAVAHQLQQQQKEMGPPPNTDVIKSATVREAARTDAATIQTADIAREHPPADKPKANTSATLPAKSAQAKAPSAPAPSRTLAASVTPSDRGKKPADNPRTDKTASRKGAQWAVQVGSFRQRKNADSLRDQLLRQGYPVFIETVPDESKIVLRVRIGPLHTQQHAEAVKNEVTSKRHVNAFVIAYP